MTDSLVCLSSGAWWTVAPSTSWMSSCPTAGGKGQRHRGHSRRITTPCFGQEEEQGEEEGGGDEEELSVRDHDGAPAAEVCAD